MPDIIPRLQAVFEGRYLIERELGKGGMATVFLAKDIKHDREVAIKVLHPELSASIGAERFEREIKLAAKLQHPHILGMYDSGTADSFLYYVMPFVKGESLRDRLDRDGPLPVEEALQLILEVADALGHAHSQGIIHRDIKPENILVSNGHALVADFGIARAAQEAGGHKLTQTGMAVGTPVYMSPEQSVGDHIGPTADLYSLGCVLYELLAGEPPFTAKNAQALMARHAMEAVPSIRIVRNTVPEEVEDAIFASMAKVPADRPKDAAHFAELLGMPLGSTMTRRAAIRQTASRRVPTGAYRTMQVEPWWRKGWVMVAGVVVVAGLAFGSWKMFAGSRASASGVVDPARAKRIAVLYFSSDTSDRELGAAADGLTESLIRRLSDIPELTVSSRNAVAAYRGSQAGLDSIGRGLDVGTLIEGSLEPAGPGRIRVTTRLYDGSGIPLGRNAQLVISRDSLFVAGDSIAGRVSESLGPVLGNELRLREGQAQAANLAAWTQVQRGEKARKDAEQAALKDPASALPLLDEADSLLRQASQSDPAWVEPLLVKGEVALQRARIVGREERLKWVQAGRESAVEALRLDPTNPQARALRGTAAFQEWRLNLSSDQTARAALLDAAEADLRQAVGDDGSLASAYITLSLIRFERKDVSGSLREATNAYDADRFLSNSDAVLDRLFFTAYNTAQFADAQRWCAEGGRRFPRRPTFTQCHLWLMLAPDAPRDVPRAWRVAAQSDSLFIGRPDSVRAFQAHLVRILVGGAIGKKVSGSPSPLLDSARSVLVKARTDTKIDPSHELPGYEAAMRAQIGDLDSAIALLNDYVGYNPGHSFRVGNNVHWWWLELQNKPGFQALLARRQ